MDFENEYFDWILKSWLLLGILLLTTIGFILYAYILKQYDQGVIEKKNINLSF